MRKSRSAHVKCDCGEKTSKCAHLQQPVEGHKETCCCNHGGRCTCCHKKEPSLDTVPESDSDRETPSQPTAARPKVAARRRRANTVHSDGVMSFDQNGHHKPTAKHNRAAQKCGPYQLNRVNSSASTSSLGASSEGMAVQTGSGNQSPSRAAPSHEGRRVKSETASPLMAASGFPQLSAALPPLDLSRIEYPSSYVGNGTFEMFGSSGIPSEHDAPMYSAGLSAASVDWSHYDLGGESRSEFAPSSYSQAGAQSFNGLFDFGSGSEQLPRLANTTSTSGDVSEVEDLMGNGDGDFDGFGAGNNGFLRQNSVVGNAADLSSIDYDSFYQKNPEGTSLAVSAISMVEEDPAFWMPNYNEANVATVDESPDPLVTSSVGGFWEM
ncbi:hypothetical protein CDD83_9976 [Cordyceps sp. RAO-2017]|nr:hypothetical protein CDD83_9976 [Cordyceps sp. RAO-2017]